MRKFRHDERRETTNWDPQEEGCKRRLSRTVRRDGRGIERAVAAGVDARVDVWEGMPHGFLSGIGTLAASNQALDEIGRFLADRLNLVGLG